jgi:hypothetical protein
MIVQLVDVTHQIIDRASTRTIIPLSSVSDTPHFAGKSDGTALADIVVLTAHDAVPQQINALAFFRNARIELLKIKAMFPCTILHEIALWNLLVVGYHTIRKAQPELRVRVDFCCAEENDVAQAFARTMLAGDGVGFGVDAGV